MASRRWWWEVGMHVAAQKNGRLWPKVGGLVKEHLVTFDDAPRVRQVNSTGPRRALWRNSHPESVSYFRSKLTLALALVDMYRNGASPTSQAVLKIRLLSCLHLHRRLVVRVAGGAPKGPAIRC